MNGPRDYLADPTRCTSSPFMQDLCCTLDAFGLLPLLEERLARPALGHPQYRARRLRCEARRLEFVARIVAEMADDEQVAV